MRRNHGSERRKWTVGNALKTVFLVHALVAAVIGLQHLLAPRIWTDWAGIEIDQSVTWRLLGAALLAFAASSWLAYRSGDWRSVRILVVMQIVWSLLGAAVLTWGILVEGLPPLEWVNVGLLAGFAIAFSLFGVKAKWAEWLSD